MKVHHEMISSNYFPLGMKLDVKVPYSVPKTCDTTGVRRVKRNVLSDTQQEAYKLNTEQNLSKAHLNLTLLMCEDTNCTDPSHLTLIRLFYNEIVEALLDAGNQLAETTAQKLPVIPGWNEMCAEIHSQARNCFLQ